MTGNSHFSSVSKARKRRARLVLATTLIASVSVIGTPSAGAASAAAAQPPTFSDVTPLIVMKVNGVRDAIVTAPDPVATDASGSTVPVTCSPASGSTFPLGDTNVSCTATDAEGAEALVSFVVRVLDEVPPPAATDVVVRGDKTSVTLTWRLPSSPDLAGTEIVRYPGAVIVFRSTGTFFVDSDIRAGARYQYRVASYDWADNHSLGVDVHTAAVNAKLIEPQEWAQLTRPPRLAWASVRGADYYNVQLWAMVRGGSKKVLSIWPSSNHLQLSSKWVFGGRSYGLTQGRYRWYVWPGLGRLVDAHYGGLIGSHVFVIVR